METINVLMQSLGEYQKNGMKTCTSIDDAGFVLWVDREVNVVLAIDLQEFNKGPSLTNCIEPVYEWCCAYLGRRYTHKGKVTFIQVDSEGFIDQFNGTHWMPLSLVKGSKSMSRTSDSLIELLGSEKFESMVEAINTELRKDGMHFFIDKSSVVGGLLKVGVVA